MFPFIYFPDIFPKMDPGNLGFTILCCAQCPVKFQNRERGIEFCRSRKKIKLVFIQGQVRLRHFLGRTLRLGQARGPSRDPTSCQSLRRQPTDIIILDLQNSITLSLFSNFTVHCAQQKMANAWKSAILRTLQRSQCTQVTSQTYCRLQKTYS